MERGGGMLDFSAGSCAAASAAGPTVTPRASVWISCLRVNFPASKSCSSPLMTCSIEPSSGHSSPQLTLQIIRSALPPGDHNPEPPLGQSSAKRTQSVPSTRRLYSDFVVHGILNPLFATEISFRCLNRNVTEQKLDLLQFASGGVAKPCAGSAEIVRR